MGTLGGLYYLAEDPPMHIILIRFGCICVSVYIHLLACFEGNLKPLIPFLGGSRASPVEVEVVIIFTFVRMLAALPVFNIVSLK